ncbi:chromosome partitioning protein [Cyclobacterium lianum]|uniref:Chromosome partitioning protein n=1 Tax=Cyclobacterium lianum TaxID=388280 RepID=A0A1M7PZG8_9BACT|nr:ParA family protein [Cyclobacterium lianum]SHN23103.1 chromosome partitioning protein [Cyclobacterium lianum]
MIILFANQKGGVGKSTLSVLFSNYLSLAKNKPVKVYDMDFQRSLYNKAQAAEVIDNEPLYPVEAAELSQFTSIQKKASKEENQVSIIDLAGKMDDDELVPVFRKSDLILCPFSYDEYSVSSTIEFSFVILKINPKAKIIFIPNRVRSSVKYETMKSVQEALKNFGVVTNSITERIDFQRITTYDIPANIIEVIEPVFESIYNEYIDPAWHKTNT